MNKPKRGYHKFSDSGLGEFKDVLKNNPNITFGKFVKAYPKWKLIHKENFRYHMRKIRAELGIIGRYCLSENQTNTTKKNLLYKSVWHCSCQQFKDAPIKGLQSFLQLLNSTGRAKFDLVEIKLYDEERGGWIPTWEIREGKTGI